MADVPPSVASLLRSHREARGLSFREAARRASAYAKVSEGTWRRYEKPHADIARDETKLAAMAAALSISPDAMTGAGRPDAAAELQRLMSRVAARPDVAGVPEGLAGADGWSALMGQILAGFADIDAENLPEQTKAQLRGELIAALARSAAELRQHMRVIREIGTGGAK